jgi:beta-glucosidase
MKPKKILLFILFIFISVYCNGQVKPTKNLFENPNLKFEERVDNLVGLLTLEEKVSQMLNSSPAIPRLNIPAYDWWNETLHGVARTPFKTTVYPQAIAMAATFDKNSLFKMADYSALEGRAIYTKQLHSDALMSAIWD